MFFTYFKQSLIKLVKLINFKTEVIEILNNLFSRTRHNFNIKYIP